MRILDGIKAEFGSFAEARQAALSGKASDLERVISFLLKEEEWKRQFFVSAGGALVFNKERFLELLENRELDSSYTRFSNKIGLGFKGKSRFLKAVDDVVLNFPYKDCVLKGAQGEDGAKTHELFFNEILAASEIDALFRPKALCNFELVSSEGEESVNLLDELRSSNVNLLLKGNNLLALHTLKRRRDICGNVKLIYIDPPYNTGNDSFSYNDRFGHSTWLAFMKSRLEVAREFLRDDGVIFIQCDDSEQAYLKVLCDEIYGRDNFVSCIVWLKGNAQNDADAVQRNHEYILCYAKSMETKPIHKVKQEERVRAFRDGETGRFYCEGSGLTSGNANSDLNHHALCGYTIYYNPSTGDIQALMDYDIEKAKSSNDEECVYKEFDEGLTARGYEAIRPAKKGGLLGRWVVSFERFNDFAKEGRILVKKGKNGYSVLRKEWVDSRKVRQGEDGALYAMVQKESPPKSFVDFVGSGAGTKENGALFGAKTFSNPKPEALLKRIIEISTNEGDLVMDFFAGSGTTLAVAHKMRRRWVGIEQMGYIEAVTKERLKKVVAGEQGGVSKSVGWQGGGRFVYAELAPLNAAFKEKIAAAGEGELAGIYKEMEERAFLDYRVDLPEMLNDGDFASLPLEEKKRALFDALDGNMDYVLLSDLEDEDSGVDGETRERNRAFFGI